MKNLYHIQTLLVGIFSLLLLPLASAQLADPITVQLKSSGSSYTDQFSASADYVYGIVEDVPHQFGTASISEGGSSNTLKVTFTPTIGVQGSADLIVNYYTLASPMFPVTRFYRFIVSPEIVIARNDRYVVDLNAANVGLDVLSNDSTSLGNFSLSSVSVINGGSATLNTTGDTILYTPEVDFEGETRIQYIVCDSLNNCSKCEAHILVRDPNLQDQLVFQKYLLNQEPLEIITPFAGFEDVVSPSNGTLDSVDSYSWRYVANAGYAGNDTIELGLGGLISRKYIITVYQKQVNVQAIDDKFYVRPGLSVGFNVLNNDLLDYPLVSNTNPSKGSLTNLGNGSFIYTPNSGYRGVDKFTYTACFDDTVNCETATVLVHVTDLEPENTFTYTLQTSQDLPLVIDHPIAYTDFSYIISDQPQNGSFIFYEGVQTVSLPCESVEGYHQLVYTPEPGFTGVDHFEYYYCIQPSNLCYQVEVDINVIAAPEPESCPCVVDCLWPGDADLDGRVDMSDLLAIGNKIGETGTERNYADPTAWFGQHADGWSFNGDGSRLEFLDANGDGAVTDTDIDLIDQYYYKSHDIVVRDVQQKLPYQFSLIPVQFSLDSGDVVILDVSLGNNNVPVLDLKGTKFSVNIPAPWMDSSSVQVIFHQNSWLSEGASYVSMGKVPWDGRIDAGYSKVGGNGQSGFGVIATIVFIIEDDAEGFKTGDGPIYIPVSLEGGTVMGSDGHLYDVEGEEIVLTYNPNQHQRPAYDLIVYPNPAVDQTLVHVNGKTSITDIRVVDPQGRVIQQIHGLDTKQYPLDVASLPAGLYFLQVNHTHGVLTETISVVR
jgi:hypothetical protein